MSESKENKNLIKQFKYEEVLDEISELSLFLSPNLEILWANAKALEVCGKCFSEIKGKYCYNIFFNRDIPCEVCPVLRAIEQKGVYVVEKERSEKFWLVRAFPVFGENGDIEYVVHFGFDLTESRKEELRLRELMKEKNIALREMLFHLDVEKNSIKENIEKSIEKLILPRLNRLKILVGEVKYIDLIIEDLKEIVEQHGFNLTKNTKGLSQKEFEIFDMVSKGLSSKEIASVLKISNHTVLKHRKNIRKKLGLTGKKNKFIVKRGYNSFLDRMRYILKLKDL